MAEPFKRAFVCGHPVAHSRSPLIHGHWLRSYGIAGDYGRVDVAPEAFDHFLATLRDAGYVGGNVTIPHKEAAFRLADRRDEAAEIIGAVNTVWFEDGVLAATNTDWIGFSASLDADAPRWRQGRNAVMLGAGGAGRAILHALRTAGYDDIRIVNRTVARAQELADHFGGAASAHGWAELDEMLGDVDLLINTTSLGMDGAEARTVELDALPPTAIVTDLVYVPLVTPLLAQAAARGLVTVDGLGMLLHQAVPGFERWFGRRPQVTAELRDIVVADLERHA